MSSGTTTGFEILAGLGTFVVLVMAGFYYYSIPGEEKGPTGMGTYSQTLQRGGKKTRRQNQRVRKTRRNLH